MKLKTIKNFLCVAEGVGVGLWYGIIVCIKATWLRKMISQQNTSLHLGSQRAGNQVMLGYTEHSSRDS